MARGISVHVGVKEFIDPPYGSLPNTVSCARDAELLAQVAATRGFEAKLFAGVVRLADVSAAVEAAAAELGPGDYFLLTFSSHGFPAYGVLPRAWCFSDETLDRDHSSGSTDSVQSWLTRFKLGVRVLVVANCCFAAPQESVGGKKALVLPFEVAQRVAARDKRTLDVEPLPVITGVAMEVMRVLARVLPPPVRPTFQSNVYELAACGASERAFDGTSSSAMTPFARQVFKMAKDDSHGGFADFMDLLEKKCKGARIPEPVLIPFDPLDVGFESTGPYRVK